MISARSRYLALFLALGAALLAGCTTNSPKHSSIPWSQPASWEGTIPGMGTTGAGAR